MASEDVIDHQSGYTPVAVFKWMNTNVAIVEYRGKLYWSELSRSFCIVVPIDQIAHQCRSLFRRCILESVTITSNDGIRTSFVLPGMNDVARLNTSRQCAIYCVILTQEGFM